MTDEMRLTGLGEIADQYDAILCDVWGVVHDGRNAFASACEALKRFRETRGPVILITNAPVPNENVTRMFPNVGVPDDCYDLVVSSGDATRAELQARAPGPAYRIGPDYDDPLYQGLDVQFSEEEATFISCTGLRHMPNDEPDNYRKELSELAERGLEMVCANPDVVFRYGDRLIWSAGALAELYESFGGRVIRPGKPDAPIYRLARKMADDLAGRTIATDRFLAIGDGPVTDVKGAMREGVDCYFVGGGIHGEKIAGAADFIDGARQVLAADGVRAAYAAPELYW